MQRIFSGHFITKSGNLCDNWAQASSPNECDSDDVTSGARYSAMQRPNPTPYARSNEITKRDRTEADAKNR